jgi:hypothetical protein
VVEEVIRAGDVIECRKGQSIIKAGVVYRNLFIILEGEVEARPEVMGSALPGADADALSDSIRVVALREQDIRRLVRSDLSFAAKLLLNISRIEYLRLVSLRHLREK